jgi:hypothetical protein
VLFGVGIPVDHAMVAGGPRFLIEVAQLIEQISLAESLLLMVNNALRFIAWQHILLVPLVFASLSIVQKTKGLARPLVAGPLLTLIAVFALVPWQGNGWGYRYLHGLIGNFCLLAGYGWIAVTSETTSDQRAAAGSVLGLSTAFTVLALLPAHILQAHSMETPYRAAMVAIRHAPTDLVFVDPSGMQFANDLVRNDPFLHNRPKILYLGLLDAPAIENLCSRFTVSVFDRRQGLTLGMTPYPNFPGEAGLAKRRELMQRLGCGANIAIEATGPFAAMHN